MAHSVGEPLPIRVMRELTRDGEGIEFLRWLIAESEALKVEFPADHVRAAYREGKRELGIKLVTLAREAGVVGKLFGEVDNGR